MSIIIFSYHRYACTACVQYIFVSLSMFWGTRSLLQAFSYLGRSERKRRAKIGERGLVRQAKTTSAIHYNITELSNTVIDLFTYKSICNQTSFSLLREIQTDICGGGDEE